MTYRLLTQSNDEDIPRILSIYKNPLVSLFVSIDEANYWRYVAATDGVYFYKIYNGDILVGTIHLELYDCVLYMSVVVFPDYQKHGIATDVIKDIQAGKFGLNFHKIQVSIDERNLASLKLFENVGFVCASKDEELLKYVYNNR